MDFTYLTRENLTFSTQHGVVTESNKNTTPKNEVGSSKRSYTKISGFCMTLTQRPLEMKKEYYRVNLSWMASHKHIKTQQNKSPIKKTTSRVKRGL